MCYPVCGTVHIKEPLLLIGKSSLCGGSVFLLSLSEWSFTICLTPYNRKYNVYYLYPAGLIIFVIVSFMVFILWIHVLGWVGLDFFFFFFLILV